MHLSGRFNDTYLFKTIISYLVVFHWIFYPHSRIFHLYETQHVPKAVGIALTATTMVRGSRVIIPPCWRANSDGHGFEEHAYHD